MYKPPEVAQSIYIAVMGARGNPVRRTFRRSNEAVRWRGPIRGGGDGSRWGVRSKRCHRLVMFLL